MTPESYPNAGDSSADDQERDNDRLEPQSIDGLSPEEALRGFMEVDPEKVQERLESEHEGEEDE